MKRLFLVNILLKRVNDDSFFMSEIQRNPLSKDGEFLYFCYEKDQVVILSYDLNTFVFLAAKDIPFIVAPFL
jgi:hypothetical protein